MNATIAASTDTATRTMWKIDADHTEVGFEVRHLMISKVRGRFSGVEGTLTLEMEDLTRSAVEVEIEAESIDTRQAQRDEHLRSADFLEAARFPSLTFRSTAVERSEGGLRLTGDLTIRGVTRAVTLDVVEEGLATDPWGGERIAFSASTRLDRREFGLTWNQAIESGGVLVGNEVTVNIDLEAIRIA